jgi:hypothetical protein
MARRTPSTRQHALGLKKGKILFGRKCNPVVMKSEGTASFGKRGKMAPAPHSGLNANKARLARDKIRAGARSRLSEREAYNSMLAYLVDQQMQILGAAVVDPQATRQFLRTQLSGPARRNIQQGLIVRRNELVKVS